MQNIKYVVDNNKCCGCGTCAGVCPNNTINIIIDDNGFYRPEVMESLCLSCKLCLKMCPMNNKENNYDDIFGKVEEVYSGWCNDESLRYQCASGGIATALSLEYLEKGYGIGGTGYSENNILRTNSFVAKDKKDILMFKSSKYMPSQYSNIVKYICNNRNEKIMIVGLPCQIAGIRNLIGYENNNIILIDILCGRVVSYRLLEKYVEFLNIKQPNYINFRDKTSSWYDFSLTVRDQSNLNVKKFRETLFGKFLNNKLFTQNSCYNCTYGSAGLADITLGDFWNEDKFAHEKNGVSIIVARTKKGKEIIESSNRLIIKKGEKDDIVKTQPHFLITKNEKQREKLISKNNKILKEAKKFDLYYLDKKYNKIHLSTRIKNTIRGIIRRRK